MVQYLESSVLRYSTLRVSLTVQYLESSVLRYSTLRAQWYRTTAVIQGLAASEQARRVTDWRGERRWEMGKLKDDQQ